MTLAEFYQLPTSARAILSEELNDIIERGNSEPPPKKMRK